ncbi:hypothetical protein [Gloeocapsa sp. PCC 73106]|uniref:hypothetical protein n=1 Tax=Gloeocapsa sp. PCC 73106 TaxID=102232 RepID=UPI000304F07A|nr:hypothetical protein [Gloeocapsa sp. PCC 73106]
MDIPHSQIIAYLENAFNEGAKFFVQKHLSPTTVSNWRNMVGLKPTATRELKAICFNAQQLHSQEGEKLVDYLLETEKSGDKIFVRKPDKGLRRVFFSDS